ncbi:MAG: hypothetical protein NTX25_01770 [Proteobacteria bacterium]|nr:hypothetical protein [Pseudomonadota bacterium]
MRLHLRLLSCSLFLLAAGPARGFINTSDTALPSDLGQIVQGDKKPCGSESQSDIDPTHRVNKGLESDKKSAAIIDKSPAGQAVQGMMGLGLLPADKQEPENSAKKSLAAQETMPNCK